MHRKTAHTRGSTIEREFVITRVFNAPREKVWKAWTDPDELKKWFGPKGFTMPSCQMDFRRGGTFHYSLRSPDGMEIWGKWIYLDIKRPEQIVLIQSFSNPEGGLSRHPLSPTWPLETLSMTTFTEVNGKTTLTLKWATHAATEEENRTFDRSHDDMKKGWSGTFEQLADYLAKT